MLEAGQFFRFKFLVCRTVDLPQVAGSDQPRPEDLLLVQNDGCEKPLAKAAKVAPKVR